MARKGWDALSETYRKRLQNKGISRSAYESGASLNLARGHIDPLWEAFQKRAQRFVRGFGVPEDDSRFGEVFEDEEIQRIKDMGIQQGQAYMDYRRNMTRLYESGDYKQAEAMYKQRNKKLNLPEYMWWYHGMFGG